MSSPRGPAALVTATAAGLLLPNDPTPHLPGRKVDAVTADRDSMWMIVDSTELYHASSTGSIERAAVVEDGAAGCLHVHDGRVLVGGEDAALWELREGTLAPVASFRDAPTRRDWYTPWGGPPSVLSMASHDHDLYVGVHVGGILHRADGADTWSATIDLHVDVHEVVVEPSTGTIWAATGERGLAESRDRGRSWSYHTDGLHGTYCLAVALTGAGVLVGASSGHAARDGAVYLFADGRFRRATGLPDRLDGAVGPRRIVARGDDAALVAPGGSVYVSTDAGRHWSALDGVAGATAVAFAARG